MLKKGHVVSAVVTIVIALAAGHLMQSGSAMKGADVAPSMPAESWTPLPTRTDAAILLAPAHTVPAPTIASVELVFPSPPASAFARLSLPPTRLSRLDVPPDTAIGPPNDADLNLDDFGVTCGTQFTASALPGALLRLDIASPCTPHLPVEIAHAGLAFRVSLGAAGVVSVDLPALSETAEVTVRIGPEDPVTKRLAVPDAARFKRVAVAWSGQTPVSIHALEFGATPGGQGHVSARHAGREGASGTVRRLGDPDLADPMLAEIYSFPSWNAAQNGSVRISLAARVTEENCDQALDLSVIQSQGALDPDRSEIGLMLPGCAAVGNILVLKNLVQDLKIAADRGSN